MRQEERNTSLVIQLPSQHLERVVWSPLWFPSTSQRNSSSLRPTQPGEGSSNGSVITMNWSERELGSSPISKAVEASASKGSDLLGPDHLASNLGP